ncbi:MAG: squalene/phytoene synthase family protein [Deltaproteobacteria bacterium]|nr:squalene/phytoene synthase family protein [Deltaproteobacteria bacterium]
MKTENASTITARSRSNFSSAFLFLPKEKRLAIKRVYAFFRIIDDIVDEAPDSSAAGLISTWKNELDLAYTGGPSLPLMKELQETIVRFKIPKEYFLKLIEGCEMDLAKHRYLTFEELYEYCYRVAGVVGLVCMKIFEYQSPTSEQTAIALGVALQLTNIIRDVGVDLDKGRIYLPEEDLKRFGVSEKDLIARTGGENFSRLMEYQYERAKKYYEQGTAEFKNDPEKKLRVARIMASVYFEILNKIRRKKYPVLVKRVRLSTFQKSVILFRIFLS